MDRTSRATAGQSRRVPRYAGQADVYSFFNLLTGPSLLEKVEFFVPEHRERLYPPTETLAIFVAQALSTDRSCQKAVDDAAVRLRIVVPFAAGGGTDVMARMFAQRLSESLKAQVVVQTLGAVNSCRVGRLASASGHQQRKVLL